MHATFKNAPHFARGAILIVLFACADPTQPTTPLTPSSPPPAPSAQELGAIDVVLGSETGIIAEKASGSERAQIASGDFRGLAVSPDGARLAYVREKKLYTSEVDGTDSREIASNVNGKPSWSPDQKRVAFSRDDGIYIIELISGIERHVTRPQPFVDSNPAWSPDGKRIAFSRFDPDYFFTTPVLAINVDEGNATQLPVVSTIYSGTGTTTPIWSPDGTKIAFISNGTVYTIATDGTGIAKPVSFPNPPGSISALSDWSSDGKWLAFTVSARDHLETHIGDFTGRSAQLTSGLDFINVALRRVDKPTELPSFSQTVIFKGPEVTYNNTFTFTQTYILYPDGKFTLRFDGPSTYSYSGTRAVTETGFNFLFDVNDGRWQATATLDRNKLIVHYNTDMMFSDFFDGTFVYAPGAQP